MSNVTLWIETNGTRLTTAEIEAGASAAAGFFRASNINPEDAYAAAMKHADMEDMTAGEEALADAWDHADYIACRSATAAWAEMPEDLALAIG